MVCGRKALSIALLSLTTHMVSVDVKHNILLSIDHPSLSLMVSVDVKHHILLSIRSPVPKLYVFLWT